MRRLKFIIPMLLFGGACNAPSMVAPTTASDEPPSTSVAADSTSTPDALAEGEAGREGGIMMGSGG